MYIIAMTIVSLPVAVYMYFFFKRFLRLFHMEGKDKKTKIISLIFAVLCEAACWRIYDLGGVILLHFIAVCIITDIIHLFVRLAVKPKKSHPVWEKIYFSGIAGFMITSIMMGYGYYNMGQIRQTEYSFQTEKELTDDLKIVQISDLHTGTVMDGSKLSEYAGKISALRPDVFVMTGDIFDESTTREEMQEAARILGGVETRYGVYYVYGNHDSNRYRDTPNYTQDELKEELLKNRIQVLEDQAVEVNSEFTIVGRKDASGERRTLEALMDKVSPDSFVLVLDHQPVELEENARTGADLQLSGHTHAGQIWPTGEMGILMGGPELNYGNKRFGDYEVVVSSGIGGWSYPIRTGGHSEYVVITIHK